MASTGNVKAKSDMHLCMRLDGAHATLTFLVYRVEVKPLLKKL